MVSGSRWPIGMLTAALGATTLTRSKSLPFRDLGVIARRSASAILPPVKRGTKYDVITDVGQMRSASAAVSMVRVSGTRGVTTRECLETPNVW